MVADLVHSWPTMAGEIIDFSRKADTAMGEWKTDAWVLTGSSFYFRKIHNYKLYK